MYACVIMVHQINNTLAYIGHAGADTRVESDDTHKDDDAYVQDAS